MSLMKMLAALPPNQAANQVSEIVMGWDRTNSSNILSDKRIIPSDFKSEILLFQSRTPTTLAPN